MKAQLNPNHPGNHILVNVNGTHFEFSRDPIVVDDFFYTELSKNEHLILTEYRRPVIPVEKAVESPKAKKTDSKTDITV